MKNRLLGEDGEEHPTKTNDKQTKTVIESAKAAAETT